MTKPAPPIDTVASTDGVDVVVHQLAAGPDDTPILIAHATGFHGRAYRPLADALPGREVWALDLRGHGLTGAPPHWDVQWHGFGDDTTAVARWLAARGGDRRGLVGFGHSLGGATLLMAARRHRRLFRSLVLFEPIAFPVPEQAPEGESPLTRGARKRRRRFASYDEAIANFASKPPMSAFDHDALGEYVYGGFEPVDSRHPEGPVVLRCTPEFEAATFDAARRSGLWDELASISVPTAIIGGPADDANPPSTIAEEIARRLPHGRYVATSLDHFGPFTHPVEVAAMLGDEVDRRSRAHG